MNILTTNGWVGRYVTDWAGPEALLRCVDIVLGAPNYPGDVMRLTGRVTAVAGDVVTLAVRGANGLGDHVKGTVELVLPARARAREVRRLRALGPRRDRRHRRDRVLEGLRPQRAAARGRGRVGRARRRGARARGRGRHGHLHDGQQPRDRGEPLARRRRSALLLAHALRRRRGLRAGAARGDGRGHGRLQGGRLLPRDERALAAALRHRRAGSPAGAARRGGALRLALALRPADAGLVGRDERAALPARVRRDHRGLRPRGGGRPQARRHQPEGLVLPQADHARRPPALALDRRAAAPARLLPGERRRGGGGRHVASSARATCASRRCGSRRPRRAPPPISR